MKEGEAPMLFAERLKKTAADVRNKILANEYDEKQQRAAILKTAAFAALPSFRDKLTAAANKAANKAADRGCDEVSETLPHAIAETWEVREALIKEYEGLGFKVDVIYYDETEQSGAHLSFFIRWGAR